MKRMAAKRPGTWRSRTITSLLGLGVVAGISLVTAQPAMAEDTYFTSCGFGTIGISGVVRANPDRHNIVWQVHVQLGAVDWQVRDYDNEQVVGRGTVSTGSEIIKDGTIGGLYGRYYLRLDCHGGYTTGMIAGASN